MLCRGLRNDGGCMREVADRLPLGLQGYISGQKLLQCTERVQVIHAAIKTFVCIRSYSSTK